ncbi:sulfatase [Streptomyces sp. NBC_01724]|uniref:sulfatase n=1 Tax=Streptomyces sp. NBC_01724 TaxID=2975922 RepID=UPI002E35EFDA|nr:sulfatase [Streptomyces sp. NBC_01724]
MSHPDRAPVPPQSDSARTEEGPTRDGSPAHGPDCDAAGTAGAARDDPGEAVVHGLRERHPAVVRSVAWVTTALATALVLFALLLPNQVSRLTPGAFARIPVEGILGVAVLLVLPPRARRVVAVFAGVGLGLLTILKFLDMGFYASLDRPFDPVLDWILLDDAEAFLRDSVGRADAIGALIGIAALALALLAFMTLAVVRLSRLLVRHSAVATRTTLVLGTAWITFMALGTQIAGVPVASRNAATLVEDRAGSVRAGLKDEREFEKESAVDAFGDTPADQLLTGLRGKDVIFTFIESYGRSAVEDPAMASQVDAVLADGTSRLSAAGFSSRSGWLTSPTTGAGSWLAHTTFMSGLWVDNQQRYRSVTSSDRLTLTGAFRRADAWRTVGIMPGVTRAWPEGKFFGLDNIHDSRQLGYKGPKFSWTPVPDQYSLSAFERLEHGKPGRDPLMAEIILASSHNPWAPIPRMIGWNEVGDGSVYDAMKKAGKDPKEVWRDPAQVRTEYRRAIEYSLHSLISYVEKYGDDNTVLVFLGDHQPVTTVTDGKFGRDVPVAIVAHDPAVLDHISGWGWQDGLKPGPSAPVWRMDTFRDRFLTAFGPQSGPNSSPPIR